MIPLLKGFCLDPRERASAIDGPIADAVNIPLSELGERTHELPPAHTPVKIAAEKELAEATTAWLVSHGRSSEVVPYSFGFHAERLWDPNPLVFGVVERRPSGHALDLGCGTGRDAIYLASAGWEVVAVDVLPDALERGRLTANRLLNHQARTRPSSLSANGSIEKGSINWKCCDVSKFSAQTSFDLIAMLLFLDRSALISSLGSLAPKGFVALEVFTPTNRASTGKPRDSQLTLDEAGARQLLAGFEFLVCEESWRRDRHTLQVLAQKPA